MLQWASESSILALYILLLKINNYVISLCYMLFPLCPDGVCCNWAWPYSLLRHHDEQVQKVKIRLSNSKHQCPCENNILDFSFTIKNHAVIAFIVKD